MRMKQGDIYPFQYDLKWDDGTAIDLTLADTVELYMTLYGETTPAIDAGECTIVTANAGRIKYEWEEGETDDPGMYKMEFVITFDDGSIVTVPSDDDIYMLIIASQHPPVPTP